MIDREELAWAAGFFDGEGSIGFYVQSNHKACLLKICIGQKDPDVLYRFDDATGGIGWFSRKKTDGIWTYQCTNSRAEKVIKLIYPWLSLIKIKQANEALGRYKQYKLDIGRTTLGVTT